MILGTIKCALIAHCLFYIFRRFVKICTHTEWIELVTTIFNVLGSVDLNYK